MSSFPTSLDSLPKPSGTTAMDEAGFEHGPVHTQLANAIENLQAKVGVNGSAVVTSLDYRVGELEFADTGRVLGGTAVVNSVAVGATATTTGAWSVAVGPGTSAAGEAVALGDDAVAGSGSAALGSYAVAANWAVAVGQLAKGTAQYATALGWDANATGSSSTAVGTIAEAAASGSVAVGHQSFVDAGAEESIAIGKGARVEAPTGYAGIAIGSWVTAGADSAIAIGEGAGVGTNGEGSVALGQYAYTNQPNTGVLGTNGPFGPYNWVVPGNFTVEGTISIQEPTLGAHAATKQYVDDNAGAGGVHVSETDPVGGPDPVVPGDLWINPLEELATGLTGPQGDAATITLGSVTTLNPGSTATIVNVGDSQHATFNFGIPRGATVAVGSTTTLNPGESATVTNTGSNGDSILNFGIPKGEKGDQGEWVDLTQTQYDALGTKDPNTLYLIIGP